MDQITKEMTIEDIFEKFPQHSQKLAQEMTNTGLHCVGCSAATWETLEQGAKGHGMDDEEIEGLLGRLNRILAQKQDLNTVSLTPRAAKKFLNILEEDGKTGWGLRFGEKSSGCKGKSFSLDFSEKALDDDKVIHSQGVDIHMNEKIVDRLMGSVIDYVDGLHGAGFKVSNPNVKSSCGCGNSHGY